MSTPYCLKILLKHHAPDEIYDYLLRNIGPISLKIKQKHAIITFPNQSSYMKVLTQFKNARLVGKKLDFSSYTPGEDLLAHYEKNQGIERMLNEGEKKTVQFQAFNEVDELIHKYRVKMEEKINEFFEEIIVCSRERVYKLGFQITETDLKVREMNVLKDGVENKLKDLDTKIFRQTTKIRDFINQFSTTKPKEIEVEPTFRVDNNFIFSPISIDNCDFVCERAFQNTPGNLSCRRLCALNKNEFAVTSCDMSVPRKGFLKIYDTQDFHAKEIISAPEGASGVCLINSMILFGTSQSTFNYLNLQQENRELHDGGRLIRKHDKIGTEMIEVKRLPIDSSKFLTLCKDNVIREVEMVKQEIIQGQLEYSFEESLSIDCEQKCRSLEMLKDHIFGYGVKNQLWKFNLMKRNTKKIQLNGFPQKIKKHSENCFLVCIDRTANIIDSRSDTIVQKFVSIREPITSIESLQSNCLFYGSNSHVGLLDERRSQFIRWQDNTMHKGSVTDILKLEDRVVSCDISGNIFSWKLKL